MVHFFSFLFLHDMFVMQFTSFGEDGYNGIKFLCFVSLIFIYLIKILIPLNSYDHEILT